MKLMRPRTFIAFAIAGLTGAILLHTSQNVQHAQDRLAALERSVELDEEKLRMYRAEWEALNRPERLERLASEFLDLLPPAPDQMASDTYALPEAQAVEFTEEYDGQAFEPVLQPVSAGGAPSPARKPASKPVKIQSPKPPAAPKSEAPSKTKNFDQLLGEIGGSQ